MATDQGLSQARQQDGVTIEQDSGGPVSRRKLLFGSLAALGAFSRQNREADAAPTDESTRFLVDRLTFGWTQEEQTLADMLGYHQYLEHHLNYTAIDDSALAPRLSVYEHLGIIPYLSHLLVNVSVAWEQMVEATLVRAVYSKRQLYQKMVEFWSDHFNVSLFTGECAWIKNWEDEFVIRPHALGKFRDILSASVHSACMLHYLNNELSVVGNPNENYARELMELHTLGVDGGYTQQDVVEVARCLTGWDFWRYWTAGANRQMFRFDASRHDFGPKTVLGHAIPAGQGIEDGEMVINILASHPSTARYISLKLCRKFWSENPPVELVDAVTATYTATDGDIKAMLRTLFTTLDPAAAGPKLKRPFHLVASALRATNATYVSAGTPVSETMLEQLSTMGHHPFTWSPPDGFPDRTDYWVGLPLARWNFGAKLMNGEILGVGVDPAQFYAAATTPDALVDKIKAKMFGGRMTDEERTELRNYLATNPSSNTVRKEAIGLAISAPSFQWH